MKKSFWQSNTIRVALAAVLATWAAYFGGSLELTPAIMSTVGAVIAIFLRKGVGVPIAPLLLIGCLVAFSGCSTVGDTTKEINYETGAITNYGYPFQVRETTNEAGVVTYEMVAPDGSSLTLEGMPNMNNLTINNNLSDAPAQTTEVKTDAAVDADVSVVPKGD